MRMMICSDCQVMSIQEKTTWTGLDCAKHKKGLKNKLVQGKSSTKQDV
jgi:hypothetical protein